MVTTAEYFAHTKIAPEHIKILDYSTTDIVTVIASAVSLGVLRYFFTLLVLQPIVNSKTLDAKKARKFVEFAWFSVYYVLFTAAGYLILKDTEWFSNMSYILKDFPNYEDDAQVPYLRFYYLVELGFYFQALFSLVFIDTRMKDFWEYVIHHIATIVLISVSLTSRWHRVGSMVLIIHDFVDVFLYLAKAFFELGYQRIADVLFPTFILSFIAARFIAFPKLIYICWVNEYSHIWPSNQFVFQRFDDAHPLFEATSLGICVGKYCVSTYWILFSILCVLLCLHIYWFNLILNVLKKSLRKGGLAGDPRDKDHKLD